jgi:hypothetical protein
VSGERGVRGDGACRRHSSTHPPWRLSTRDAPKLRPTMQCQVGPYLLSNCFLMKAAISFSMLYFSSACLVGENAQRFSVMFVLQRQRCSGEASPRLPGNWPATASLLQGVDRPRALTAALSGRVPRRGTPQAGRRARWLPCAADTASRPAVPQASTPPALAGCSAERAPEWSSQLPPAASPRSLDGRRAG